MRSVFLLALVLGPAVGALPAEQGYKPDEDREASEAEYLQLMREFASDRVVSAQMRVSRQYETTVNALVHLAQKAPSDGHRKIFMRLLGEMRARQAAVPLIRQITFEFGFTAKRGPLAKYPAAEALAEIGEPAVHLILAQRLASTATEQELQLFAAVIREHHRQDPEVGRFRIAHYLEQVDRRLEKTAMKEAHREHTLRWRKSLARLLDFYDAIDRGELFPAFGTGKAGKEDITDILTKTTINQ